MTPSPPLLRALSTLSFVSLLHAGFALAQGDEDFRIDRLIFEPGPLPGSASPMQVPMMTAVNPLRARPPALAAFAPPVLAVPATTPLPGNTLPEELLGEFDPEDIDRYLESIAGEELRNGPYAPELLEQFLSLGELYQRQGEHEDALDAFAKAEYISRINNGLYHPEQFGIVENMIESHLALGELSEANQRQNYLLRSKQQYYGEDSLEVVPALEEVGDWNMDAFNAGIERRTERSFDIAPGAIIFNSRHQSPRELAFGNLYIAQVNYYQAILNLVNKRQYFDPRLVELEYKLIEGVFLGAHRNALMRNPDFYLGLRNEYTGTRIARGGLNSGSISFVNGRNALERIYIYLSNNPASPPLDVANALIGLGDWHVLFNRPLLGVDYYREAWNYLQQREVAPGAMAELFSPQLPRQLPLFTPLPHSRAQFGIAPDAPLDYAGYLDVSFQLSRFGHIRNFEITGKSANASARIERRLKRLLNASPFRPRIVDGELTDDGTYAMRYSFAMVPETGSD